MIMQSNYIEHIKNKVEEEIIQAVSEVDDKELLIFCDNSGNSASESYMRNKIAMCEKFGIKARKIVIEEEIENYYELYCKLVGYAGNENTGIIVQLPFYNLTQADVAEAFARLEREGRKFNDVDGFLRTYEKTGHLINLPATSLAIYQLTQAYAVTKRLTIAVVGQSDLVTKPLAKALIDRRHTVISMNSLSDRRLLEYADIVVLATGQLQSFWYGEMKPTAFVIDVGIGRKDGVLCGDFVQVVPEMSEIQFTPVPNGVGQLTTRFLILKLLIGG